MPPSAAGDSSPGPSSLPPPIRSPCKNSTASRVLQSKASSGHSGFRGRAQQDLGGPLSQTPAQSRPAASPRYPPSTPYILCEPPKCSWRVPSPLSLLLPPPATMSHRCWGLTPRLGIQPLSEATWLLQLWPVHCCPLGVPSQHKVRGQGQLSCRPLRTGRLLHTGRSSTHSV